MNALVIFAVNVEAMAAFYEAVISLERIPQLGDGKNDIRLGNGKIELLIHSIPAHIAKTILISSPPEPREESAMKPVFEVELMQLALEQVSSKGGVVTGRSFTLNGLERHDILDPEGNVVQLRANSFS